MGPGFPPVLQNLGYLVMTKPEYFGLTRTFSSYGRKRFSKCSGKLKYFEYVDRKIWNTKKMQRLWRRCTFSSLGIKRYSKCSGRWKYFGFHESQNIQIFWRRLLRRYIFRYRSEKKFKMFGLIKIFWLSVFGY